MEFHLIVNGKQEGPFTVEELAQKGLNPDSEVWAPGMSDWMQAGDVPELTAVLQRAEFEAAQQAARAAENQPTMGQPYEPVVPPTPVQPQTPRYGAVPPVTTKKKSGCMPWLIAGVILAILFATMVFTCPTREDHEAAITEVTKRWVGNKVQDGVSSLTGNSGIGGVLSDILGKVVRELTDSGTEMVITNYLDVDNYVVCSVGRISVADVKDKMVSFGIFGHVFTFGEDDIEKIWVQALDDSEAHLNIPPLPAPAPQSGDEESEDSTWNDEAVVDSILGLEVPPEVDTLVGEAIRMAKEWAKRQIDEL
jgi:hypothetical protein